MHHGAAHKDRDDFQREVERIVAEAGEGVADFTGFVFLSVDYSMQELRAEYDFRRATFMQGANFRGATFMQGVDFRYATFMGSANFSNVLVTGDANFRYTTFTEDAKFFAADFKQDAHFLGATFTQDANFGGATFTQDANFGGATFTQDAGFGNARFTQDANFGGATFTQDAGFGNARFTQGGYFDEATFTRDADFESTEFRKVASFQRAKFLARADFHETKFRNDKTAEPGPIFSLAQFSNPEEERFYNTYLGQALFHNCDVSQMSFSSVGWRKRKGSGKRMAFEEDVDFAGGYAEALKPSGDGLDAKQYGLIAELYQQLKKNYDGKADYWTAGDFHYGEMEMKRLSLKPAGRIPRFVLGRLLGEARMNGARRWLHQRLGLVAWYKYASQYGESYARAFLCLVGVLILCGLLYPYWGLRYDPDKDPHAVERTSTSWGLFPAARIAADTGSTSAGITDFSSSKVLTYRDPFFGGETRDNPYWVRVRMCWYGVWTAAELAAFQKELLFVPVPRARWLELLEVVLTSTLFALFLLAVRRQFRR